MRHHQTCAQIRENVTCEGVLFTHSGTAESAKLWKTWVDNVTFKFEQPWDVPSSPKSSWQAVGEPDAPYHFDIDVPNRSPVQKRLSIYNWNPGPRRGKEGGIDLTSRFKSICPRVGYPRCFLKSFFSTDPHGFPSVP